MGYAKRTTVPVAKLKFEIETMLRKTNADGITFHMDVANRRMALRFGIERRVYAFVVRLPFGETFMTTRTGQPRTVDAVMSAKWQEERRLWLSLVGFEGQDRVC